MELATPIICYQRLYVGKVSELVTGSACAALLPIGLIFGVAELPTT